jgi:hypothetical protein
MKGRTMEKNDVQITLPLDGEELAVCEELWRLLYRTNALPGRWSWQQGGPFGAILSALRLSLATALANGQKPSVGHGRIAERLLEEGFDNMEPLAHQISLWNDGYITLPELTAPR